MEAPNLTPAERLMLANQFKLLATASKANSSTYQNNAEILLRGYTGMYHEIFDSISEPHPEALTDEVHDILSMFLAIENVISELPNEQKSQLDVQKLSFRGFDANNDKHYRQAEFMVEKLELYDYLKDRQMNSHTQSSLPQYRQMLVIYNRDVVGSGQGVTFEVLQKMQAV